VYVPGVSTVVSTLPTRWQEMPVEYMHLPPPGMEPCACSCG